MHDGNIRSVYPPPPPHDHPEGWVDDSRQHMGVWNHQHHVYGHDQRGTGTGTGGGAGGGGAGGGDRSGSRGRGEMEEDDDPVRRQWANHMLRNQVGP